MVGASVVQVLEHGAVLLSQRVRDGHDALGVPLSALALRAVRSLTPEDERPQVAFGQIVRGVHVGAIHEGLSETLCNLISPAPLLKGVVTDEYSGTQDQAGA